MQDPNRQTRIEEEDAKGGTNEGVVRWVLLISLSLAIAALSIIWITGALSQDPVESAGTTTGRIEAEAENRNESGADSDTGVASSDTVDKMRDSDTQ